MTNDGEKAITKVGWTEGLMDKRKDSRTAKWISSPEPRLYKRVCPSVRLLVRQSIRWSVTSFFWRAETSRRMTDFVLYWHLDCSCLFQRSCVSLK